jgi:hypothetical protein
MLQILGLLLAVAAMLYGYSGAKQFVRTRLRYVDAALSKTAPWVAAVGATAISLPLFVFLPLPFFGVTTAGLFGLSVAAGVAAGAKSIRTGSAGYIEG